MTFVINDELLQERVERYMDIHKEEIIADIDNRIDKSIKKSIRDMFNNSNWGKQSIAEQILSAKVEGVTKEIIDNLEFDKLEIERVLQNQITRRVKALKLDINI